MTVIALCNIGLRDITRNGQLLHPARTEGAKVLAELDDAANTAEEAAIADGLAFPIIEPSLHYIIRQQQLDPARKDDPGPTIHQVTLFGTDQALAPAQHRAKDTLHFAALATRCLPRIFDSRSVGQIRPELIQNINPALYDETFDLFGELLAAWNDDPTLTCYVVLGGGIPAANTALLLQGVRYFGARLKVIYAPEGSAPQELRIGMQVADTFNEAAAIEHLRRLDFVNARTLLQELEVEGGLLHLVDYAAARFNFDFAVAQAALYAAVRDGAPTARQFINEQMALLNLDALLADDNAVLTSDRLLALLRELYWNAHFTYDQGRYADFLGRVYRFQEAVLRYLVETIIGLPTDLNPKVRAQTLVKWRTGIENNPPLLGYLQAATYNGQPLDWMEINRPTYRALLKYALGDTPQSTPLGVDAMGTPLIAARERGRFQALMDRINRLDRLIELRHRTIIGHGFTGVSAVTLAASIKQENVDDSPPHSLQTILNMLKVDTRTNPYRVVADYVARSVRI